MEVINHGVTSLRKVVPLLLDASGRIIIGATIEPSLQKITGVVRGAKTNASLSAGTNNIYGDTVPAGQYWIVTQVSMTYTGTTLGVTIDALIPENYPIMRILTNSVISIQWYCKSGFWIMEPGDRVAMAIFAANAGDAASIYYTGYKVAI